jgi:hypothetical protein
MQSADSDVDKVEDIRSLKNDVISFINKEDKIIHNESVDINIKLILEDILRTAKHASDIAEAAMNQTTGEGITAERISLS